MPATTPARVCGYCDGHPTVAISTGSRRPDGTLPTLRVDCPACHGTGTTTPTAPAALAGARR